MIFIKCQKKSFRL